MGILTVQTVDEPIRIVCSEDEDVTPHEDAGRGWIPYSQADVRDGATVLEVRPLNPEQEVRTMDLDGTFSKSLQALRIGLVSVDGDKSAKARDDFMRLSDRRARFLAGVFVRAITAAIDTKEEQARYFRAYDALDDQR